MGMVLLHPELHLQELSDRDHAQEGEELPGITNLLSGATNMDRRAP